MTDTLVDCRSAAPTARTRHDAWPGLLGLAATGVAAAAAGQVHLPVTSDLGLGAVLPWTYWAALLVLNVAFVVGLRRAGPAWVPVLLLGCLVLTVYGAASFATDLPRTEVAWRHVGVADVLVRTHGIDPRIDAYFNWPGFFAGSALFTEATGVEPLRLALWAPVWNTLLWLVALGWVLKAFTSDMRRIFLALWVFTLGNWIDQDYLSPQATAFFLHLVALGLLLHFLGARPEIPVRLRPSGGLLVGLRRSWFSRVPTNANAGTRVAAVVLVLLLALAVVGSHQLTPFVLLLSVAVLVVSGRCWATGLPLLLVLLIALWLSYPASAYLASHPLLSPALADPTPAALSEGLGSSPGRQWVLQIRVLVIATVALLALIGLVRDRRQGRRDLRPVLLAAAPLPLVVSHSYGGEMLLRVALFWLPFAAYLAAGALMPGREPGRGASSRASLRGAAVVVVCAVLAVGSVFARYGNARFDVFTRQEVAATAALYRMSAPGELLISGAHPTPWTYREYEEHPHTVLTDVCLPGHGAQDCYRLLQAVVRQDGGQGLLLLTRANRASVRMQGDMRPSTLSRLERRIRADAGSSLLFVNRDARIYRLTSEGAAR